MIPFRSSRGSLYTTPYYHYYINTIVIRIPIVQAPIQTYLYNIIYDIIQYERNEFYYYLYRTVQQPGVRAHLLRLILLFYYVYVGIPDTYVMEFYRMSLCFIHPRIRLYSTRLVLLGFPSPPTTN